MIAKRVKICEGGCVLMAGGATGETILEGVC